MLRNDIFSPILMKKPCTDVSKKRICAWFERKELYRLIEKDMNDYSWGLDRRAEVDA